MESLFFLVLVCDNALPAIDFEVLLYLPSLRTLDALLAIFNEVCFLFICLSLLSKLDVISFKPDYKYDHILLFE